MENLDWCCMIALYKKCLHYCSHFTSVQSAIKPRKKNFQTRRGSSGDSLIMKNFYLQYRIKIKNNLKNSPTPSKSPVGFINKGNIYYANTILQALSVIPLHWGPSSAESAQLSPLLKSFALYMAIKKISCANWFFKFSVGLQVLAVLLLIVTSSSMLQKFYK